MQIFFHFLFLVVNFTKQDGQNRHYLGHSSQPIAKKAGGAPTLVKPKKSYF
jgi:hypothetical protein